MGCRGVHFSLSRAEVQRLRDIRDERERLEYVLSVIEEEYFENHREDLAENDKAWDAIHRCFDPDGLSADGGSEYPLGHFILGGEHLYFEDDHILSLKSPELVREIAEAAAMITEPEMRRRYDAIDAEDYHGYKDDDDFKYTWGYFQEIRRLFRKAAAEGRCVLFSVDQ
ncbi:YfbM family protein [Paludisphaera sp.]|uniref:YfbM family protein n=1 Tax=Paludisphaera sp. TaxID=2017432 RepID=UPI00301BF677